MKYDCYKYGSGALEIDLNEPIESAKETNKTSIDDVIARARAYARCMSSNQKLYNALGASAPYHSQYYAKTAEENDQLADWLEELKAYRANEGMPAIDVDKTSIAYKPICLGKTYNCGVCRAWIGYYDDANYCWNCGKKIDWSDVD